VSTLPRVLLTGGTGQVGWELRRALAPFAEVVAPPRAQLDLRDADALRRAVRESRPAAVVNAAAYTSVDRAETDPATADAINGAAPGVLAAEAARAGALMVHFSTDYVFGGGVGRPWREDDAPDPLNVYGASKLRGEREIAAAGGPHLVFRIGWVYGRHGGNFLRTVLRAAAAGQPLRVVDDQVGAPTWSRMVAEATAAVLAGVRGGGGFRLPAGTEGVYHVPSGGETTWFGFARALLERDPALAPGAAELVQPIPTSAYPTPARRPACSLLDGARLAAAFGVALPHWREQLELCMADGEG
jgi:dTDP-4-dehydrorhamnose reductase